LSISRKSIQYSVTAGKYTLMSKYSTAIVLTAKLRYCFYKQLSHWPRPILPCYSRI